MEEPTPDADRSSVECLPFSAISVDRGDTKEHSSKDTCQLDGQDTVPPPFIPPPLFHSILKVSNISWDTSIEDIVDLLIGFGVQAAQVHIPIDRLTGKTRSDLYLEMKDVDMSLRAMHSLNRKIIKGRSLSMSIASLQELHRAHFNVDEDANGLGIGRQEALSLVNVCRNYKCAERPFEHIISILRLVEWYRLRPAGRDRLFQIVVAAIESLQLHLKRPYHQFNPSLWHRLVIAAKSFPAFTPGQQAQLDNLISEDCSLSKGHEILTLPQSPGLLAPFDFAKIFEA